MSDITYRLVKGTELTFGELDRNFGSLDSDIISLQSQVDSLAVAAGLDSARAIAIIDQVVDSAYVKLHYEQEDIFRDSAFITNIADSQIRLVVDSQYVTDRVDITQLGLLDSAKVVRIIDSYVDSEYIYRHVDSDYIKSIADSDYIHSAADSEWIKFIADSNYVQSAADSDWIKFVADSDYVKTIADSAYINSFIGLDSERVIRMFESDAQHILPLNGETYDLGTNLRRWRAIYTKDLFVSPATIYFGTNDSPQRSRISLDSTGEFQLTSPTQTGFIATSTTGTAIDSNTVLSLIDSSYVQARALFDRFDDSADIRSMIDSAYIQSRQIVGGSPWDSAKTASVIDSAYVQARQVDLDTQRDSAFINNVIDDRIDSTQFLATTATTTDVAEGDNLYYTTARHDSDTLAQVDSAYVQQRVRGPEMIAGGRIKMSLGGVWTQNSTYQKQLFGIFESGQAPGGTNGITRDTGLYKFQFDSANLARITSGDDYTVMVTADYGANDPTASSRTVNVMVQRDSSFQIVWERSDTGDNENYADSAHINFQVWLY